MEKNHSQPGTTNGKTEKMTRSTTTTNTNQIQAQTTTPNHGTTTTNTTTPNHGVKKATGTRTGNQTNIHAVQLTGMIQKTLGSQDG